MRPRFASPWVYAGLALAALAAMVMQPAWAAKAPPPQAVYVVLGGSGAVARVVYGSKDVACPGLTVDGQALPTVARAVPSAMHKDFPITVCEALLPTRAARAALGKQVLPLPGAALKTVVALGDTGCRLKAGKDGKGGKRKSGKGKSADSAAEALADHDPKHADHDDDGGKYQDCNVPSAWPFAAVAAQAAAAGPDLVLHVGDYLYRESKCPKGDSGCEGSPHHDDWPTWQADFFKPAAPLLARAPWIAVRGNHEICKRAGAGYLLLMDPRPAKEVDLTQCVDISPSYTVTAGGQGFAVIDTSNADDTCDAGAPCNSADYAPAFQSLAAPAGSWLVTHKPVWAVRKGPKIVTAALQQALPGGSLPSTITLALAGHIHFWQALSFADARPPQLVLGNGGTLPAGAVKGTLAGTAIGGTTVSAGRTELQWGYTQFVRSGSGWTAGFRGVQGRRFDCAVTAGRVACP